MAVDFVFHFGLIRRARVSVCDSCTGGPLELAYAVYGVRRLQRAGLCRVGSRKLRFAHGSAWDKTGLGSCTRLTWSSLSVFHVSVEAFSHL